MVQCVKNQQIGHCSNSSETVKIKLDLWYKLNQFLTVVEVEVVDVAVESLLLELGFIVEIVDNCVREGSVLLSFIGLQHSVLITEQPGESLSENSFHLVSSYLRHGPIFIEKLNSFS